MKEIEAAAERLHAGKAGAAEELVRVAIRASPISLLVASEDAIRTLIAEFPAKKRENLRRELGSRLVRVSRPAPAGLSSSAPAISPAPATPAASASPSAVAFAKDVEGTLVDHARRGGANRKLASLRTAYRERLAELSKQHIYQWSTYYRDVISELFASIATSPASEQGVQLDALRSELAMHSTEIFAKGFRHQQKHGVVPSEAVAKSMGGLSRFLELPLEAYGTAAGECTEPSAAVGLRQICSVMLASILEGYGATKFGSETGWQLLPRFPRSWAHVIAFLTASALDRIQFELAQGELRTGLVRSVLPVLEAVDRLLGQQTNDVVLPRQGFYWWPTRRLTITLSLPPAATRNRFIELHCYFEHGFVSRETLLNSIASDVSLVAAPLRTDVLAWVMSEDTAAQVVANTERHGPSYEHVVVQCLEILQRELTTRLGGVPTNAPFTYNWAKNFPLQDPFLSNFMLVQRKSVRALLRTFEHDVGIRLWCSIRRSGKTTACFQLTTNIGTLIKQTMDHTGQHPDANIFYRKFVEAVEARAPLADSFFRDAVRACATADTSDDARLIFILDEYETLFERMRFAGARDRELRYTVLQPLLNQMVAFSREHLLMLLGQRPDAHYIFMDQNQLSAYVKQDTFPLFDPTEFFDLLRKILTARVDIDMSFATAVYAETSGHPYLTVQLLVHFFDWLITQNKPSTDELTADDFAAFTGAQLEYNFGESLRHYAFFKNAIAEHLSDEARTETPWLYAVYTAMQLVVRHSPETLTCPVEELTSLLGQRRDIQFDVEDLLRTAQAANFLHVSHVVRPTIRLLGRLASVVKPQIR